MFHQLSLRYIFLVITLIFFQSSWYTIDSYKVYKLLKEDNINGHIVISTSYYILNRNGVANKLLDPADLPIFLPADDDKSLIENIESIPIDALNSFIIKEPIEPIKKLDNGADEMLRVELAKIKALRFNNLELHNGTKFCKLVFQ